MIFKTHLDAGFTDLCESVVKKYNELYIPAAIEVGREMTRLGRKEGFVWTTGSWLIHQYLEQADDDRRAGMEEAIRSGWISWHGLPHTMHSELADAGLFEYGLSLSDELDRRFGRKTVGAKYTDVPGHTIGIVPHLARHGITLLHIGVNPASTTAEAPQFFRWRCGNSELNVMYNSGYGDFFHIPGTEDYIHFAHTGDNLGPQSAQEIVDIYERLYREHPGASIRAGDLNDAARMVEQIAASLPVVTSELGDTWIHGGGTDPQKLSQYRALLRLAPSLPEGERRKMYSRLIMVPEHTWGLNEQVHLVENRDYARSRFDHVRANYKYKKMELSWAEQRRFVLDAVEALDSGHRPLAQAATEEFYLPRPRPDPSTLTDEREFEINGWRLRFDGTGAVDSLVRISDGRPVAGDGHTLGGFSYDEYSADDVWQYQRRYLVKSFISDFLATGRRNWALDDFGKGGLEKEVQTHTSFAPDSYALYRCGDALTLLFDIRRDAPELYEEHGCPPLASMTVTPCRDCVKFDFAWFGKPANRVPEALWLKFDLTEPLTGIDKLGTTVDPLDVLSCGARELHATQGLLRFGDILLETLDAPLISVGGKHIYGFENRLPDTAKGVFVNLFNNQWGTNFPMWNEGDSRFRFVLYL